MDNKIIFVLFEKIEELTQRVEALEFLAAEYESERQQEAYELEQDLARVPEWDIPAAASKVKRYVCGEGLTPVQVATLNEYAKAQPAPASITGNRDQFDANDAALEKVFTAPEVDEKEIAKTLAYGKVWELTKQIELIKAEAGIA